MRRLTVSALCGVLLLVSCQVVGEPVEVPPPTAASTTTTALDLSDLPVQPSPAHLHDLAYWNAVMVRINRVEGDVFRDTLRIGGVEPRALEALRHVYTQPLVDYEHEWLLDMTSSDTSALVQPPGDLITTVTKVVKVEPGCVTLDAFLDFSQVAPDPEADLHVLQLVPRQPAADTSINPTPWLLHNYFIVSDREQPDETCEPA